MRAVRWHGRRDVRFEAVPTAPPPGPGQIRVAVAWCGLCGTDVHEYRSGPIQVPVRPHPVTGRRAPIVLGHEVSGWVADLGPGVQGPAAGQLVALNALIPCGSCRECRSGAHHICPDFGHIGMSADGGLADLLTVPATMAVPAPVGLDADIAALAEPFAVCWHLVRRIGSPHGRRCQVIGAGSIGLATALLLRALDNDVVVVDLSADRLALATALGFATSRGDATSNGAAWQPVGRDQQADAVLECSGSAAGFQLACRTVRPGGLIGLAGLPDQPVPFDVSSAALREVTLIGSASHQAEADLRPALDFLADHAGLAGQLITERVPLERAVTGGLDVLNGQDRGRHTKILVQVDPGAGATGSLEAGTTVRGAPSPVARPIPQQP